MAALAFITLASVAIGTKNIAPATVLHDLMSNGGSDDALIIRSLRLPRTLVGLSVGVALGAAGALMQALTRNPLADPGILGVNAGGAAAVVTAIGILGVQSPSGYVWFALFGAGAAAVVVYLLGSAGHSAGTPIRMTLAGAAVTAALTAFVAGLILVRQDAFDGYRFWVVGSLAGRPWSVLADTGPFLLAGAVLAMALARPLNAIALGEDAGRALGAHLGRTRGMSVLAVTLLCGGAVAAAGPIGFVGLTVPHVARAIAGPDQRWVLAYSMLLAPTLVLGADILGRVAARPGELEVGIVTAFIGAPVFLWIARRGRLARL